MKILIDNGHGENTQGKRSPDGVLREYAYAREIAEAVVRGLVVRGYDAERIVREASDVSLTERTRRVNDACKSVGRKNVLLVSIHCNAAGNGSAWMNARGWSAHVSDNASAASKRLALSLIRAAEEAGLRVRKYSKRTPYWTQNLAICRDTHCPAVLTENLFQDNREDVAFLLSGEGRKTIAGLHVQGIIDYISNL